MYSPVQSCTVLYILFCTVYTRTRILEHRLEVRLNSYEYSTSTGLNWTRLDSTDRRGRHETTCVVHLFTFSHRVPPRELNTYEYEYIQYSYSYVIRVVLPSRRPFLCYPDSRGFRFSLILSSSLLTSTPLASSTYSTLLYSFILYTVQYKYAVCSVLLLYCSILVQYSTERQIRVLRTLL